MRLPGSQEAQLEKRSIEEVFSEEESPLLRYAFGLLGRRELASKWGKGRLSRSRLP